MKKQNNMKKMLVFTMFSMLASISMFVGTTYAWFTDEVSVSKNQIVAGNLDVELYSKVNGEYAPVTAETTLFNPDALWEPGHVEVVNLKVANVGSLALRYSLGINILPGEVSSINKNGDTFKISDFIEYAVVDGDKAYPTGDEGRALALADAEASTPRKLSDINYEEAYVLLPESAKDEAHPEYVSDHCVTLIVYMPEEVGNEANHQTGAPTPKVELGVNVSATQYSYELDGFNSYYDDSATGYAARIGEHYYSTVKSAITNAKDGDTIKLLEDAATAQINYTPINPTTITLDLNGHTLSTPTSNYLMMIGDYKKGVALDFTIKNGKLDCYHNGIWTDSGLTLTLDNVELTAHGNKPPKDPAKPDTVYGVYLPSVKLDPLGDIEVIIKNNSKVSGRDVGVANFGPYPVTIENSTIEGGWFGLSHNGQAIAAPATYNITGSTISATGTEAGTVGIYISNTAGGEMNTLNLTNTTVTGGTAVEMKHSNATITGCTLVATAAELSAIASSNGACTKGYSLAVSTNTADPSITGTVTVDATTTLTWKKAEAEEAGKVFVFNPDGATTAVTVNGVAVSETMTYSA